jgi:heptosyltransferase-2
VRVPKSNEVPRHERFYYLELLRRAGWIDALLDEPLITLYVSEPNRRRAGEFLVACGARQDSLRIAIGAGASYGSAKCWAPSRFAELANRLRAQTDADVILFGTAREAAVTRAISSELHSPPIDLTEKTAIADLPPLLSQCHLFIGNDSGAMHVAAAVGLPVVAVFGPTDPHGTAPVTPRSTIVQQKPYCSPCFLRHCPTDHRCMRSITSEMVEAATKPWLHAAEAKRA